MTRKHGSCKRHQCEYSHPKNVCRYFAKVGDCPKGNKCEDAHNLKMIDCNIFNRGYCRYSSMTRTNHHTSQEKKVTLKTND